MLIQTKQSEQNSLIKWIFGTTKGLKKATNEDTINLIEHTPNYTNNTTTLRFCVCDGHWGDTAAIIVNNYWQNQVKQFPQTEKQAIESTETIQTELFNIFGTQEMTENDLTPETAFIAGEATKDTLSIISYGDCGLITAQNGHLLYDLEKKATWLGAFSHLKIRNRQPLKEALIYKKIDLQPNTQICVFTDGIDECIYEKPTISHQKIAEISNNRPETSFQQILKLVEQYGAEDNASLLIIKV